MSTSPADKDATFFILTFDEIYVLWWLLLTDTTLAQILGCVLPLNCVLTALTFEKSDILEPIRLRVIV